jgi:hypothetical protein
VDDRVGQEKQFSLAAELYEAVVDAVQQASWPPATKSRLGRADL